MQKNNDISHDIIISSIDKELDRLESQRTKGGWTRSAIVVAIATIIWNIVDISSAADTIFNLKNIFVVFLVLSFAYEGIKLFTSLINYDMPISGKSKRLMFTRHMFGGDRLVLITSIIYWSILALLVYNYCNFSMLVNLAVYTYIIVPILMSIITLCISYFDLPLMMPEYIKSNIVATLLLFILPALSFCTIYNIFYELTTIIDLNAQQIKLAILIFAGPQLLMMLAEFNSRSFIGSTLEQIKSDLVFNKISVEDSIEQYEIAIKGIQAGDAIQKEIDRVLLSYEKMLKFSHDLNKKHSDVLNYLSKYESEDLDSEASLKSLDYILENQSVIRDDMKLFNGYMESVSKDIARLQRKISWVIGVNKDFRSDLENALHDMRKILDRKKEVGDSLFKEREALSIKISEKISKIREGLGDK